MLYINIQELSRWQTGSEELFYKVPLPGFPRLQTCPACRKSEGDPAKMSSNHVFRDCTALKSARSWVKIDKFIVSYEAIGHEDVSTLMAFVNGGDAEVELLPDDLRLFSVKFWQILANPWVFSDYCLANPGYTWLILATLGKYWLFSG